MDSVTDIGKAYEAGQEKEGEDKRREQVKEDPSHGRPGAFEEIESSLGYTIHAISFQKSLSMSTNQVQKGYVAL